MLIPLGILAASGAALVEAGYFGGGLLNSNNRVSTVEKLILPAETVSTLGTGLSSARHALAGMANSGVAGYFGGGDNGSRVTTVDRFAFPADTRTTLGTGLSVATDYNTGINNKGVAGYFGGGFAPTRTTRVDKFAFPGEARTTLGTGLADGRGEMAGFANKGVAGYFAGGYTGSNSATVDKFAFPSDTRSSLSLVNGRRATTGAANQGVAGYVAGGQDADGYLDKVEKFAFPSDTRSVLFAGGSGTFGNRWKHASMSVSGKASYFAAGERNSGVDINTVTKIAFPSETATTLAATLANPREWLAGMTNGGDV